MRVLHVNDHPPGDGFGGAEIYLARLLSAQRALGTEVDVLSGNGSHRGLGIAWDLWDPGAARRLRARIAVFRPDVLHVHNVVRELSPSVLRATGLPTVVTFHDLRSFGGSEHRLPDPRAVAGRLIVDPLVRRLSARAAATIGVSEVVTAVLRQARLPRPTAIPVPVPAPLRTPVPVADCQDVVFAGRLSQDKGVEVLVTAFARLNHPTARLVIAGDGPLHLMATDRVVLAGRLSSEQVSALLGRARVVVVPSLPRLRREGSSLTAVEAARHGRPLVTSDDPAVAEVARQVGADVVPAGDVAALAARLDHWLSHPEQAAAAGARGHVASEIYDPAAVAVAHDELYRSL